MKRYLATVLAALWLGSVSVFAFEATPVAAPPTEVLAKDLQEEIVRIQATVKDMYGRQATKPVPITIYRPAGDGPFPLVVFNHGRSVAEKRAQQGRYRPETAARYLVGKGFVVMVPNRIGYWETYGDFDPENSACKNIEPMSIAASQQVLATVDETLAGEVTVQRSDAMRGVGRALRDLGRTGRLNAAEASRVRTSKLLEKMLTSLAP